MRSNRRRNWFIKRFALGLAIAAFAAPVAQAKVDEGSSVQANGYQAFVTDFPSSQVNASDYGMPRAMPVDYAVNRGDQIELVRSQPRSTGDSFVASDYGMPRALPTDYALASGTRSRSCGHSRAAPRPTRSSSSARSLGRSASRRSSPPASTGATGPSAQAWHSGSCCSGWGAALATRHAGRAQTA